MADAATNAYHYQPHDAQPPLPQQQQQQQQPPPPTYYDNVSYDGSQKNHSSPPPPPQMQYNQAPPAFQKPNINIKPLIETDPATEKSSEFPRVGFSGNSNSSNRTKPTSEYAFDDNLDGDEPYTSLTSSTRRVNLRYQLFLDRISPHSKARWVFSLLALGVFLARVILSQGWYVICYGLGIYYLNLLIGFISPRVDPSLASDDEDAGPMLPTHANDEFKPFIRRVPEFKFWISGTKATLIALFLTLFNIFDVPVFWPILLIYFIILFACTMRQQIKHMIRYSYVPWDSGKKKYAGRGGGGGGGGSGNDEPTTI